MKELTIRDILGLLEDKDLDTPVVVQWPDNNGNDMTPKYTICEYTSDPPLVVFKPLKTNLQ